MGKLAEIKTKQNNASVEAHINSLPNAQKQKDSFEILQLMQKHIKEEPKMWGSSIIGFGKLRYKSPATDREVDWFNIGFAPRKANISLYFCNGLEKHAALLQQLGKHKTGKGCLYINKLADVDTNVLEKIIVASLK